MGTTSKPGVRAVSNFTFIFVGIGVRESGRLSSLPAKEPVQVGASLVLASFLHGMTLSTLLHKQLLTLGYISGCVVICHLKSKCIYDTNVDCTYQIVENLRS